MKRELTRARSKLEEEKAVRGNIQVYILLFLFPVFESLQKNIQKIHHSKKKNGKTHGDIFGYVQADLEQYQERVRVCMESMDRFESDKQ